MHIAVDIARRIATSFHLLATAFNNGGLPILIKMIRRARNHDEERDTHPAAIFRPMHAGVVQR